MNAAHTAHRLAFALALLAGAAPAPLCAQVASDSTTTAPVDSLQGQSRIGAGAADPSSVADSLMTAVPDSLAEPGDGAEAEPEPWLRPWRPGPADVGPRVLGWTRPIDFETATAWLGGTSVRVGGEKGMDAFFDVGPFDFAPELLIDGLPSRNPADLDPSIWDRAPTNLVGLSTTRHSPETSWGATAIRGTFDDPLVGRTVLNARFTSTRHETYTREVGLRTPGSERMLRYDFREFKTEEGYDYSFAPAVLADPDRGRSKQRQFRFAGSTRTGVGELGIEYGRGRRYATGNAVRTDTRERWTGRLALSFDRGGDGAAWHGRLYHLDFRDEWFDADSGFTRESRDGARLGLRVERAPRDGGFYGGLVAEHQSARFLPPEVAAADTSYVEAWTADLGLGWRGAESARWKPWLSVRLVGADHTVDPVDLGGRAGIRWRMGQTHLKVIAERIIRTPTLVETYGVYSRYTVTPTAGGWSYDPLRLTFRPGGELAFERQDRAGAGLEGRWSGLSWSLGYTRSWLRDGIGWEPGALSGSEVEAEVVSGIESNLDLLEASLGYDREFGRWRLRLLGRGHFVPGELESTAGRPGGWPRGAFRGRIGLDREFFSRRNRLGVDFDADFMGEHFDDLTGPLGGVVPASTVFSTRAWLGIRDAELSFGVENLLDAERMETLGTWRRYRQFRLGLNWDFFN